MTETTQLATSFFREHAGWAYNPATETPDEGRDRGALQLAQAETWASNNGVTFRWEDDWDIGSHKDYFGPGSAYEDREPETCQSCVALRPCECCGQERIIASLGCIDDATPEYRRVIEAELAEEAQSEVAEVLGR